ncbi:protein lin-12-like [Mytilus edulis]|uniref:protein lin-12-like n=1 Tax=Mytilus edulis TaxID=6550 RepID=UPI0039F0E466
MRKYVTNDDHVWFDVGCSSSQRCSPITSIIGKRNDDDESLSISSSKLGQNARHKYVRSAGDTIVCEKCCSGDICNAGSLCGTIGFLHEMVCFNCSSTNEDGCNTIALCDQNEKCFIEKAYHNSTSNIVWKTGCRHKDVCQHLQPNPGTDCSSSCCSSDLCNMKCINYNTEATCADKSQTCTNTTFQSFVCSAKELQVVCPRSCGLCHCAPNPCTHGTCTSSLRGYKCTCDAGYTGSICERGSSFRYTDCSSNQALLHFDSVKLNPYPPIIPGNITVSGHLVLGRNISGHIELQVSIHVHAIFWIPVPCVSGFGSCTYDLCSMLSSRFNVNGQLSCPPQLEKQNLPCTCPIQAGTYTLNPNVWTIPPLPSILSYLSSGNHILVDVKLVNKDSGEIMGCYNIQITFAHKCTGFGCIFG